MSFQINSDKEFIKGGKPAFIGESEFTIRNGAGADEREVLRAELDLGTRLPRVGINRTGERINNINVVTGGSGYTTVPSVTIGPPQIAGGVQALASAFIFNGRVVNIAVNEPGSGYNAVPTVTITGGNGAGAEGEAFLDTVDFELDINGAIRTSTSIISDTARILNLDIDNFVTPDLNLRGPNLKTYANNTGTLWTSGVIIQENSYRYFGNNIYQALNSGQTGTLAPEHTDGIVLNGEVQFKHIGFRVEDASAFKYNETGESGIFPRSITPLLGDRSDKIATTEYVLNLATNDVGGRIYVSSQIGSDLNDGRSAVNPVRTIKKAAQLAWATPGVKETLIVSGGDYVEDNPISLPPDASVVGDNLRLVIIRPNNPGKHIFKFGDKNYVTGVTYRDKIDSNGDPVSTWDFAMVFDDKQQVVIDQDSNGDFGVNFPIGHQIFGPEQFRVTFQQNTGLQQLVSGLEVVGVNTGARAAIVDVVFAETSGASAYIAGTIDVRLTSGSFVAGEQFRYIVSASRGSDIGGDVGNGSSLVTGSTAENTIRVYQNPLTEIPPGTKIELATPGSVSVGFYEVASINSDPSPAYWDVTLAPILNSPAVPENSSGTSYKIFSASVTEFTFDSTDLKSIRAEGEVVSIDEDITTTVPIVRIDFSQQGQAEIATGGFQSAQFGNAEDLGGIVFYTNELVGRQNTHNFKEGQEIEIQGLSTVSPDLSFLMGKQRIYKVLEDADGRSRRFVIPKKAPSLTNANYDPGQFAVAKSYSKVVTLSLLNSPNKFPLATPVDRRFQDAVTFIRNNREFIADEVVGRVNSEFAKYYYSVYELDSTARTFKIYLGTSTFEHTYVSGGTVTYNGNSYNITDFTYDNAVTGVATVTTDVAIPAVEDEIVKIENILVECSEGQKLYPSFSIPGNDDQCKDDIKHFLNALCRDLEFGSNHNIIEAGGKYIQGTKIGLVDNEIIQTVRAIEYARELAVFAMCNWRTGLRTPSEPIYTPVYSSITRYFDDSVVTSTAPDPTTGVACANVESAINTLAYLFIDVVANDTSGTYLDAAYLISRNKDLIADQAYRDAIAAYPSLSLNNIDERKCRRDICYVLKGLTRDLSLGGNAGILTQAETYYTGAALTGIPESEIGATRYAFSQVARYATAAMRNWTTGNYVDLTPTSATYDSTSGQVTVTFPDAITLPTTNDRIAFKEGALTFSCSSNGGGNHASPERFDSNFGQDYAITNVVSSGGNTTVTCFVPNAGTAAGVAHTFVSALTDGTIIVYDTVDTQSPIPKFVDWNILLDPGSAPINLFTPTGATYDPANGDFVITTATAHGLSTSNGIRLAPESFVFTCAMDDNRSEHYLPAVGQAAYGNTLAISAVTSNTITVNVGASGPDQLFTPTDASYDPATGLLDITIGTHDLGVGEGIVLSDGALSFTCAMDNFDAVKSYPRTDIDPYSGRSMPIVSRTDTTITLNVGKSGPNKYFTPTAANYNPTTGDMTVTVGQHGLGVGRGVVLEDNSFTFTCALDGDATQHTYPRPGTDPYAGKSIAITSVGSTSHTITGADYDPALGEITFTLAGHGWSNGDYIKIDDNALTFTCSLDGNATQHTYPRSYEYASGRWFAISDVTTDTFKITGLPVPRDLSTHTFVSAAAGSVKRQDGTFTINVGTSSDTSVHTFVSATANAIKHEPQSTHVYQGSLANSVKHLPQSAHTFKRTDDNSVAAYNVITGAPACANVASTIDTEMDLLDSILQYATDPTNGTQPGSTTYNYGTLFDTTEIRTYPDSYIYDQDQQRIAVRGEVDEFPIIEASPYTQNASVISFLGGGGALIDGSKVKQPNCPFPGLELDGTASFPNQGKSMVAAAFTIVSFGGTGYKVINDGYTQLVSVFVIFCADGVFCESGGYASITNSATNFGQFALRANGYREECYSFDQATITNVSSTPTGRTILTVSGLGREPLEHYIAKIDGFRNTNEDIEYFIDAISGVTVGPPFAAQLTFDNGTGDPMDLTDISTGQAVSTSALSGATIKLHRPSIVNSSSHTWEFAGSGTNYLALPENGGTKVEANEQVSELYGRVYVSGTDELGDFKVGTFAKIENRTGAITFTGTVTISEVEFLKLKGGDVVVTGFDASNTLGGANSSDSKIPTQKAVKDYITNNLGPYINKPYSTNAVPRALVELTDSGKISIDQIPALRPFQVYTVPDQAGRLSIEGALAGDIAIQQDTSTSFILNNDLDSQFLGFPVDPTIQFTLGDIFTGSISGGRIQATEYRTGVVYQINITDGGSGYTSPPTVSFSGGNPGLGAVAASATCTIANGEVVTVTLEFFNGFKGGYGYTTAPTVTFAAPSGSGTQATGNCLIESRLYGDIVNRIAIEDTDTIESSDVPSVTVNVNRNVNTSASDSNNWVSLSSNQIAATDIVSGVIETDRLATGGAANSFTFLRGDQNFALAVQSIKGSESRYFAKLYSSASSGSSQLVFTTNSDVLVGHDVLATVTGIQANTNITGVTTVGGLTTISLNNPLTSTIPVNTIIEFQRGASPMVFESSYTQGNFVDQIVIANGGSGFTNGQYFDVSLQGGAGTGLKANIIVAGNAVTDVAVTDGGVGYTADFTITVAPAEIGGGSGLVLEAKQSTVNRQYANVSIDIQRASDLTISADDYGTIGVGRFKKSQFNIGVEGNGSIELKTGADSGLDADLLDGVQGAFYLNSSNQNSGTLPSDRLAGSYNIDIVGSSTNTLRLITGTNNPTSSPTPNNFVDGIVANTINNQADGLFDGGTRHLVMTLRNGGVDFDATFGGARQLAFTDNDNMYLRGSGTAVTTWGSWQKVWTSLNDGDGSEMDADKLDGRQGTWYQNALNVNFGTLSDNRMPRFISATNFRDSLTIKTFNGDPRYAIYISGRILNATPFVPGSVGVKLYNANSQATGDFEIDNVIINDDANDNANDYTILVGRLSSGNFAGALTVGTASQREEFQDFTIEEGNTTDIATLASEAGTAKLELGRTDGVASSPGIFFNSSVLAANFNVALVATGGNATDGSGSLNVQVANADAMTILGQKIWNEGNVVFNSANVASTASLKSAVMRDTSGNFSAGTITASLTGAASLNVLKAGDSMTGTLNITGAGSNLTVAGTTSLTGVVSMANDLAVDSDTLFVDVSADKVGINAGTEPDYQLEVRGDDGLAIYSIANQGNGNLGSDDATGGARLTFSDHAGGSFGQKGFLVYKHADGSISGTSFANYFIMDSTESSLMFKVGSTSSPGTMSVTSRLGIQTDTPAYPLDVAGEARVRGHLYLDNANDNSGAQIQFLGSSTRRNFRIGNQEGHDRCFEITRSTANGGASWDSTPALLIRDDQRVAIATNEFGGNDPEDNTARTYTLNINGDVNFNGTLFQNNGEFVTSRWTEATNQLDIYRLSKVGIAQQNPTYTLQVGTYGSENGSFKVAGNSELDGTLYVGTSSTNRVYINGANLDIQGNSKSGGQVTNTLKVNGDRQYIDRYGVFKRNRAQVTENVTVANGDRCMSAGPIEINNGVTVTINDGGYWAVV